MKKWSNFQSNVLKPTMAQTVERTIEVSANTREKVGPIAREWWGSIRECSANIGITRVRGLLLSTVGSRWNETRDRMEESVG